MMLLNNSPFKFFIYLAFFFITVFVLITPVTAAGFHYSHIKIWDFGRGINYIPSETIRDAAYDFLAAHVDMAEANDIAGLEELRSRNADMSVFRYVLDVTACRHVGCGKNNALAADPAGVQESFYLHFSEDTRLTVSYVDGTTETFNIPGCPGEPTPACRVRTGMWLDSRWVYNPKNTDFRNWMGNLLLTNATGYNGIFLDEHGPGTGQNWPAGATGGGIREYGGRRLNEITADYNADLVAALAAYKQILGEQGKFLTINGASWSFANQMIIDQVKAAGGVVTELTHRPNAFDGAFWYEAAIKNVDQMVAAGVLVDLCDSSCRDLSAMGMTPGNYSSSFARWQMWRLASYYLMREMPDGSTGPGAVYFDPNFCMKPTISGQELDFIDEWLAAYEKDVGEPDGPRSATLYASGQSPQAAQCTGESDAPNYGVLSRFYDNGNVLILVRPNDRWDCSEFGDNSAVTLTLSPARQLLRADGTLAAPATTIRLRSGEAAILFKTDATTPPAPVTYTVGGTISGLNGTVILENNRSNTLSRTTNGSFVFSAVLNSGSSYNVGVSSQPSGQTCVVSFGSGVVNANVTNVAVNCVDNITVVPTSTPSPITNQPPISQSPLSPISVATNTLVRTVTEETLARINASCPVIHAGDLVKVKGKPAIYYVNAQYEVLYFPSSNEFKSWNRDEIFSGYYKKISQDCFDNLLTPLRYPAAVNFRPGTLVRREGVSQLYTVAANNTLRKISPADARAVFGDNYKAWNILDIFWPNYTTVTEGVNGRAPTNILIRRNNKVYYLDSDWTIREISATAVVENRFKDSNIRIIPESYLNGFTTGMMITSSVTRISDRAQTAGE